MGRAVSGSVSGSGSGAVRLTGCITVRHNFRLALGAVAKLVRPRSAQPPRAGSNPAGTSEHRSRICPIAVPGAHRAPRFRSPRVVQHDEAAALVPETDQRCDASMLRSATERLHRGFCLHPGTHGGRGATGARATGPLRGPNAFHRPPRALPRERKPRGLDLTANAVGKHHANESVETFAPLQGVSANAAQMNMTRRISSALRCPCNPESCIARAAPRTGGAKKNNRQSLVCCLYSSTDPDVRLPRISNLPALGAATDVGLDLH